MQSNTNNKEKILCKICYDYYCECDEETRIKKSKMSIRSLAASKGHIRMMNSIQSATDKKLRISHPSADIKKK